MTVEITGYSFSNGSCYLYASDVDERRLQQLERNRYDDGSERELEFTFAREDYKYLYDWLKRQKAVRASGATTIGDAIRATLGTITTISGRYLQLS